MYYGDTVTIHHVKERELLCDRGKPGEALKREFGLLFDWGGEFPHHFVFSKDGKMADKKAVNLAIFKEAGLPCAPSPENNNPILSLTPKSK